MPAHSSNILLAGSKHWRACKDSRDNICPHMYTLPPSKNTWEQRTELLSGHDYFKFMPLFNLKTTMEYSGRSLNCVSSTETGGNTVELTVVQRRLYGVVLWLHWVQHLHTSPLRHLQKHSRMLLSAVKSTRVPTREKRSFPSPVGSVDGAYSLQPDTGWYCETMDLVR